MNTKNFIPLILAFLSATLFVVAIYNAHVHSASSRYKACSQLAASDPAKALADAKAWRAKDANSPIARHCEALALYGSKNYADAAKAFEALAADTGKGHADLVVNLLMQGAIARKNAGDLADANQDLNRALALEPNNADIKAQLAEIAGKK